MLIITVLFIAVSEAKKSGINVPKEPLASSVERDFNMARPRSLQRPVPFGHIFKDGFEDPDSRVKQPLDALELSTLYLKDSYITRDVIEKLRKDYQIIKKEPSKQKFVINETENIDHGHSVNNIIPEPRPRSNNTKSYWNIALIQQRNIYDPPKERLWYQRDNVPKLPANATSDPKGKLDFFAKGSFNLNNDQNKVNFTTCDEFGRKALFHPDDIIAIQWVPFFIWTTSLTGRLMASKVHKFSHPTQKIVRKYSDAFGKYLTKSVDWEQPKLLMKQDNMLEMLLIAADRKGLFDAIPYNPLPESMKESNMKVPVVPIRLKIVDPYLAMMFCDDQYATIMAVAGSEPRTVLDKVNQAALAKVVGPGHIVERDVEREMMVASAANKQKLRTEEQKYIHLQDQMDAARVSDRDFTI